MIFSTRLKFLLGCLLVVAEAVQQQLHLGGYWHAALTAIIVLAGANGVNAVGAAAFGKEVPVHVATVLGSVVAALDVFQQANVGLPYWVHSAIGVVSVAAVTFGLNVTSLQAHASAGLGTVAAGFGVGGSTSIAPSAGVSAPEARPAPFGAGGQPPDAGTTA